MSNEHKSTMISLGLILSLAAILAMGCADRRVPGGGKPADGAIHALDGGKLAPDTRCVRPPGGCFSSQDCPSGQECKGCGADPCCPMCAVCYGKCEPAAATTCEALLKSYDDAIRLARQCTSGDGPKGPQCTKKVQSRLACGCPTFVNPANTSAVKTMEDLKKEWVAKSCHKNQPACPPVPCRDPKGASCLASSPGNPKGSCQDSY